MSFCFVSIVDINEMIFYDMEVMLILFRRLREKFYLVI